MFTTDELGCTESGKTWLQFCVIEGPIQILLDLNSLSPVGLPEQDYLFSLRRFTWTSFVLYFEARMFADFVFALRHQMKHATLPFRQEQRSRKQTFSSSLPRTIHPQAKLDQQECTPFMSV